MVDQETEDQRIQRLVNERVAAALEDSKRTPAQKEAETFIDAAVERSLERHLPGAIDRFLDKFGEGGSGKAGLLEALGFGGRETKE